MITNEQWQELNNILKRSELIKELAQTEINNNIIWTDEQLNRVTEKCFINEVITRNDINIIKAELQHKELNQVRNSYHKLLEQFKTITGEEKKSNIKQQIIDLVNRQDQIRAEIKASFQQ